MTMYNLCAFHSLICMCSNMHSGCHSLSKCTFLYNYRYKYRYETPDKLAHNAPSQSELQEARQAIPGFT